MKIYEVIFEDEYHNLYQLGYYKNLDDAVDDINGMLECYDHKIKKGEVKEYAGTYGPCFDTDVINDDDTWCMIRGFVLDGDKVIEEIQKGE